MGRTATETTILRPTADATEPLEISPRDCLGPLEALASLRRPPVRYAPERLIEEKALCQGPDGREREGRGPHRADPRRGRLF